MSKFKVLSHGVALRAVAKFSINLGLSATLPTLRLRHTKYPSLSEQHAHARYA